MRRQWTFWPWAPLLLGVYPVIYLYSLNVDRVEPRAVGIPLLMGLLLAVCLTGLLAWIVRSLAKGTILASLMLFTSNLMASLADTFFPWPSEILPHPYDGILLTVVPLIICLLVYLWLRQVRDAAKGVRYANAIALLLLFTPLTRLVVQGSSLFLEVYQHPQPLPIAVPSHKGHPNIYYIILDGYSRTDILKNDLGYDNSRFINFLKQRGFYVADQSRSNYAYTYLSLASSLNMEYLDGLDGVPSQQPECLRRIHQNKLMPVLKAKGYRLTHYASGWSVTDYSPYADTVITAHNINEFHGLCLRASLLRFLWNQTMVHSGRNRILFSLDTLETRVPSAEPTFTFVHLLCPHPPYVFDRDGRLPPPRSYKQRPKGSRDWYPKERYVDQLDYLNGRIERAIDHILKVSKQPPIIIIQGDHGAACDGTSPHPTPLMVRERMGILNAYYVPEDMRRELYPTISPVNSFRVILRHLFNAPLPLLPDKTTYSGAMDETPYVFQDVTHISVEK